jgi:hypothetical protein
VPPISAVILYEKSNKTGAGVFFGAVRRRESGNISLN